MNVGAGNTACVAHSMLCRPHGQQFSPLSMDLPRPSLDKLADVDNSPIGNRRNATLSRMLFALVALAAGLIAIPPAADAATCKGSKRADSAGRCKAAPAKKTDAKAKAKAKRGKAAKAASAAPDKGALYVFVESGGCRILATESAVQRMQEIAVGGSVTWDGKCTDGLISGTGVLRQEGVFIEGGRSKHFTHYYSGRANNGVRLGQWTRETLDRFDDGVSSWTSLARMEFVDGVPKGPPKPIPVRGADQHTTIFKTRVLDPESKRAHAAMEISPASTGVDAVNLKAASAVASVAPAVAPAPTPALPVVVAAPQPAVPPPVPTAATSATPERPKPQVPTVATSPPPSPIAVTPRAGTVLPALPATTPSVAPPPPVSSGPAKPPTADAPPRVAVTLPAATPAVAPAPTPAPAVAKVPLPPTPVAPAATSPVPPQPLAMAIAAAPASPPPAPKTEPAKAPSTKPALPAIVPAPTPTPPPADRSGTPVRGEPVEPPSRKIPAVAPPPTLAPTGLAKVAQPPAATPPALTAPVAALPTEASKPVAVKLATTMPDGMEKQAFGFGTGCYMDTLDGQLWENAVLTVKDRKSLRIDGWAVDDEERVLAEATYVRLEGANGRRYHAATSVQERPDVARHFGIPAFVKAGYRAVVSAESLPPGEYEVTVVMNSKGRNVLCGNGRRLKL